MRPALLTITMMLCAGFVTSSLAQSYTLNHLNASAQIDVGSGAVQWQVDGSEQLGGHWFYYRVGSTGPEASINNIGSPSVTMATSQRLDVSYANADYSVALRFMMYGNTAGSGKANMNETITVVNHSATSLQFHFYQYADFDVGGVAGGQTARFTTNILGQYYKVTQSDNYYRSVTETITSGAVPIGHFETTLDGQTLAALLDGDPTTLGNIVLAGPGNVAWAYEWDVTVAAGGSFQISKLIAVVPEPSSAAMILAGILAGCGMRWRRVR